MVTFFVSPVTGLSLESTECLFHVFISSANSNHSFRIVRNNEKLRPFLLCSKWTRTFWLKLQVLSASWGIFQLIFLSYQRSVTFISTWAVLRSPSLSICIGNSVLMMGNPEIILKTSPTPSFKALTTTRKEYWGRIVVRKIHSVSIV